MKFVTLLLVAALVVGAFTAVSWASSNEVEETLNAVDVAGSAIIVNGQSYSVSANAVVEVEEKGIIPFDQLSSYVGSPVELQLNAQGTATKIEVKDSEEGKSGSSNKGDS